MASNVIAENDASGGGGVLVVGDNSRTGHNLIVGNRSSGGGGIGGNGTNVSIGGNLIVGNWVSQRFNISPAPSSTSGGGIGFWSKGGLFIGNNIIMGNEVTVSNRNSHGGRVYAFGGGASVNGDGVVLANNVLRANRGELGSGIFIRGNDYHFINTIFRGNDLRFSDDSNVKSSTFSHCAIVIPEGYDNWTGNLSLDPEFVEPTYVGLIEDATFDQETFQSTLLFEEAAEDLSGFVGRVIRIGERYLVVDSSPTPLSLAVWGDVVGLRWPGMEEIEWPAMGYVDSFRLQPTSPMRGAGIGPSLQPNVLPYDIDGDPRSGPTCDIGADEDSGK